MVLNIRGIVSTRISLARHSVLSLEAGFDKWIQIWITNDWKNARGEPIKNKELIQYISSLLVSRKNSGQVVHLQYVKRHSGNEGNDWADRLAVEGCGKPALSERNWDAERETLECPLQKVVEG